MFFSEIEMRKVCLIASLAIAAIAVSCSKETPSVPVRTNDVNVVKSLSFAEETFGTKLSVSATSPLVDGYVPVATRSEIDGAVNTLDERVEGKFLTSMPEAPEVPADTVDLKEGYETGGNIKDGVATSNFVVNEGDKLTYGLGMTNWVNGAESHSAIYVKGTLTLTNIWGKGTIYVLPGGKLNLQLGNSSLANNGGVEVYNYGTLSTAANGLYVGSSETLYNYGDLELEGKEFKVQGKAYIGGDLKAKTLSVEKGGSLNVLGSFEAPEEDLTLEGAEHFGGKVVSKNLTIQGDGTVYGDCSFSVNGDLKVNSNEAMLHTNYVKVTGVLYQCAGSRIVLTDGGFLDIDGQYECKNNGNNSTIEVVEGGKAVVKAASMAWNAGGDLRKVYIFKTPGSGVIGLDCSNFARLTNAEPVAMDFNSIDFDGAKILSNGEIKDPEKGFSIAKSSCNPGYNNDPKDEPVDPTDPDEPVIINIPIGNDGDLLVQADDFNLKVGEKLIPVVKTTGHEDHATDYIVVNPDEQVSVTLSNLDELYQNSIAAGDKSGIATYTIHMWPAVKSVDKNGSEVVAGVTDLKTGYIVGKITKEGEGESAIYWNKMSDFSTDKYNVKVSAFVGLNGKGPKDDGTVDEKGYNYIKVSIHIAPKGVYMEDPVPLRADQFEDPTWLENYQSE